MMRYIGLHSNGRCWSMTGFSSPLNFEGEKKNRPKHDLGSAAPQ
jgi:hypothetical protein